MQSNVPEVIVDFAETRAAVRVKPAYNIRNVSIVPAETLWPNEECCKGKFVLKGTSDQYESGYPVRTSLIVKADIEAGTFETLNSVYKVVV